MKELYSITRKVTFYVLADGNREAEKLAEEACPLDDRPVLSNEDTHAYCTPNQSEDLKRRAINYE